MSKFKTALLTVSFALLSATALATPAPTGNSTPQETALACPSGEYDANYPGVPAQCVKCAAPGCPSCHNERTKKTVADTTAAERNCPPVKPH